jgi:hypothetical protein
MPKRLPAGTAGQALEPGLAQRPEQPAPSPDPKLAPVPNPSLRRPDPLQVITSPPETGPG